MTMTNENSYLADVIKMITAQIQELETTVDTNEQAYKEIKKYTVDYKNELDKYEVYNHQQNLSFIDKRNTFETNRIAKLSYLQETPYFSRIDFQFDGEEEAEKFYIGRYGFVDNYGQQLVYDWRAPISSLYYDFPLGSAYYESMGKKFTGSLQLKRQFDIKNGTIRFLVDSNDSLNDDFLINELSKHTTKEMKTIIHTIQKEQNEAIRDSKTKNLLIQGVAGSGKTSIALHRIAYLLYQKRAELAASEVLILSPNEVFSDYISTVLPELGEDDLFQLDITQLVQPLMGESLVIGDHQEEIAEILSNPQSKKAQSYLHKRSANFFWAITEYLEMIPKKLSREDLVIQPDICLMKQQIKAALANLPSSALWPQIKELAQRLAQELPGDQNKFAARIAHELKKRTGITQPLKEYEKFLATQKEVLLREENTLAYSDAFPYLFFKWKIEGLPINHQIKHLVIDEMQDYSLLQFYLLDQLFPCQKTICGDVSQNLLSEDPDLLTQIQTIIPDSRVITFNRSYRSSYEIMTYAKRFTTNQDLQPVERHGKVVAEIHLTKEQDKWTELRQQIASFQQSSYRTCGIICQTEAAMTAIKQQLVEVPLTCLTKEAKAMAEGVILTTPQFAKGLEFDQVILPDVHAHQLTKKSNLLYTSCSRALHELTLLVTS
ncbi:UvrD-helicase domain-containing protein [Enterococcus sp.]|uniref:HelD family protein n=1 Tax=Enterococcus sp. TaxID=35783 RepID=UPI0025BEB05C|nr:UvrD-helicase domain-containing protein [Enterococcus sp.]